MKSIRKDLKVIKGRFREEKEELGIYRFMIEAN
jgi:hypothetical protein